MVSVDTLSRLSTVTLVLGALLVGDAIHGTIIVSEYSLTSLAAISRFVPGLLFIWLGFRARTSVEYVPSDDDDVTPHSKPVDVEDEYDPGLSPFGEGPADIDEHGRSRDENREEDY